MEIKPCPWCGATMRVTYSGNAGCYNFWHYSTGDFHCALAEPIRIYDDEADSRADAVRIWNKRKQDSVLGKIVRELEEAKRDGR